MSRKDLTATVRRVMDAPDLSAKDRRNLVLVAQILDGGWKPTPVGLRKEGYKCLALMRDEWLEAEWDTDCQAWWTRRGFASEGDIKGYAPLPFVREVANAAPAA